MPQNPYQPPTTEPVSEHNLAQRQRLIRMKHLTHVELGAIAVTGISGFCWVVLRLSAESALAYIALAVCFLSVLTVTISNMWLLGMSIISCVRYNSGVGYLVASLAIPGMLFALVFGL